MSRLNTLFSRTLIYYLWQEFLVRYRFKYVLPKITRTALDGIDLDLTNLSLKLRNRILIGLYEMNEKRMCETFLRREDGVLEIGGAIGFIGLVCQKKIGIQQYSVCEANPDTLEVLRSNYRLNGLVPRAWHVALGPTEGFVELDVATDFWENSIIRGRKNKAPARLVKVPSAPLQTLLRKVEHKVNVLVIDIEGAEQFIELDQIPGAVSKIIIELHPDVLGSEMTYDLIARLIHKGYYVALEDNGTFAFLKRPAPNPDRHPPSWAADQPCTVPVQPREEAVV
jgi:FkbM family methyltransferase